jgi:hypothetical protein
MTLDRLPDLTVNGTPDFSQSPVTESEMKHHLRKLLNSPSVDHCTYYSTLDELAVILNTDTFSFSLSENPIHIPPQWRIFNIKLLENTALELEVSLTDMLLHTDSARVSISPEYIKKSIAFLTEELKYFIETESVTINTNQTVEGYPTITCKLQSEISSATIFDLLITFLPIQIVGGTKNTTAIESIVFGFGKHRYTQFIEDFSKTKYAIHTRVLAEQKSFDVPNLEQVQLQTIRTKHITDSILNTAEQIVVNGHRFHKIPVQNTETAYKPIDSSDTETTLIKNQLGFITPESETEILYLLADKEKLYESVELDISAKKSQYDIYGDPVTITTVPIPGYDSYELRNRIQTGQIRYPNVYE